MSRYDAVIIGAGASGLLCASIAGRRGKSILVVDHASRAGNKIRVSGGGHCNFTNLRVGPEHYWSRNRHFVKSALARFRPDDILALVSSHRIAWHDRKDGQVFCRGPAAAIVDMLLAECGGAAVTIRLDCAVRTVRAVRAVRAGKAFRIETDGGDVEAGAVVVATGGLSWPGLGATDFGLRLAEEFGLAVVPTMPGLVPLTFRREDRDHFGRLAGVSAPARVTCKRGSFDGDVLFTHSGLSGPSILQASCCWDKGEEIVVDLAPGADLGRVLLDEKEAGSNQVPRSILQRYLPRRIVAVLGKETLVERPISQCSDRQIEAMTAAFKEWRVTPAGTAGYEKAEVTLGGVDTDALSSKTMESRAVDGLYFIGEVVDVTGRLGGYNLHWAWASGAAAGRAL